MSSAHANQIRKVAIIGVSSLTLQYENPQSTKPHRLLDKSAHTS